MEYEQVFWKKQHMIVIRSRIGDYPIHKLVFNSEQILKLIKNQKKDTDIYITKYPKDKILSCIILDFDNDEDKTVAYKEAKKLKNYLQTKGLNTIIVSSGKKGYHTYTQIPFTNFNNKQDISLFLTTDHKNPLRNYTNGKSIIDNNELFTLYVKNLINCKDLGYETIDKTNFNASLDGNIRLINSTHPGSGEKCKIIEGTFNLFTPPNQYHLDCLKLAEKLYFKIMEKEQAKEREKMERVKKRLKEGFINACEVNDLRMLMPSLFGGKYKQYSKGYVFMQCPFHNDKNPSMVVTKEYYYCKSCGAKGNIYTLKELGHVEFDKEGVIA